MELKEFSTGLKLKEIPMGHELYLLKSGLDLKPLI